LGAVSVFVAVGLGVRASGVDGKFQQCAGTALYASMIYAWVFVLRPRTTPFVAGAAAVGFCWLVEFSQLTGIPAALSAHSTLARLALGVAFDPMDLLWYPVGVLPLVAVHRWLGRSAPATS
jgi:hypothetical protein